MKSKKTINMDIIQERTEQVELYMESIIDIANVTMSDIIENIQADARISRDKQVNALLDSAVHITSLCLTNAVSMLRKDDNLDYCMNEFVEEFCDSLKENFLENLNDLSKNKLCERKNVH